MSFVSLFPNQALIKKLNNEMQNAENSMTELLADKKAAVPVGGMKGESKLGLHPHLAWPGSGLL